MAVPTESTQQWTIDQVEQMLREDPSTVLAVVVERGETEGIDLQSLNTAEGGNAPLYKRYGMICGTGQDNGAEYCVNGEGLLYRSDGNGAFTAASVGETIRWVIDHWKGLVTAAMWIFIIVVLLFMILVLCIMVFCKSAGVLMPPRAKSQEVPLANPDGLLDWEMRNLGWVPSQQGLNVVQQFYFDNPWAVGVTGESVSGVLHGSGLQVPVEAHFGPNATSLQL